MNSQHAGYMGFVFIVFLLLIAPGCDDDNDNSNDNNTGNGNCPSMTGDWKITEHCEASAIGTIMTFSQSGCIINQINPWPDWTGSIDENGDMIWSGPAEGGQTMVCNADLNGDTINSSCNPSCDVTVVRN